MIPKGELFALRGEWSLTEEVIEKDYVLGWLLAGIAAEPSLRDQWVFKGGTALRKCFFETYRFSEDQVPHRPPSKHPFERRAGVPTYGCRRFAPAANPLPP